MTPVNGKNCANVALAFLGPRGTYSHQIAFDTFGNSVRYCERETIADVYHAVPSSAECALIPQENSLFGIVAETYSLLRLPCLGKDKFVRGEATLGVKHCLVARKGVKLPDVRRVLSHEQALGQCSRFLSDNLPDAGLVKVSSTAAAARALISSDSHRYDAAICSRVCCTVYDELDLLYEGIQDGDGQADNFTRFYILAPSLDYEIPSPCPLRYHPPTRALLRIHVFQSPGHPSIAHLLTTLALYVTRMDRRPALNGSPFDAVYFVEVQDQTPSGCENGDAAGHDLWRCRVERAARRVQDLGAPGEIVGLW